MLRLLNACLLVALLLAGSVLYQLEHKIRAGERRVVELTAAIAHEHETITLLDAEWSALSRPDRIQRLTAKYLKLGPTRPTDFISETEIAARVLSHPVIAPGTPGTDQIGDILKGLQ